jgi:Mrp family chromosome partitioning ATPase/capsular polysaccharide biosynthesis protein
MFLLSHDPEPDLMLDGGHRRLQFSFADTGDAPLPREAWRDGVDIDVLISKINRQRRLLRRGAFLGSIAMSALAAAWLLLRTPTWSAATEALVSNTTLQLSGQDAVVTQLMVENTLLQSQMLLARSSAVMERVVSKLGPERTAALLPQPGPVSGFRRLFSFGRPPAPESAEGKAERQALIQALKSEVIISRSGASQIIILRVRASGSEAAAELANEVTQAFLAETRDINAVVTTSGVFRERIRVLGPTARLISDAQPPVAKDGPRALLVLALAPTLGALLGLMAALTLSVFSRRIWSGEQLAQQTDAEFFGYVSLRKAGIAQAISGYGREPSSLAAALRRVRVATLERRGTKPRVLGITSFHGDVSQTTVATGLALLFAAEGRQVLLVDAALETACLSRSLALDGRPGLRDVLADPHSFGDMVQRSVRTGLDVLPVGGASGDIDTRWPLLLRAIERTSEPPYDWVIMDLPPLQPTADIRAAGAVFDDLILVVEEGRVSSTALAQALKGLGASRDKLLGTLICKEEALQPVSAQRPVRT